MKTTINKVFKGIVASTTSAIMCLTMIGVSNATAYAYDEVEHMDNYMVEESTNRPILRAPSKPTSEYDWSAGNYIATLEDLRVNTGSWTSRYFKTTTHSFYLKCNLNSGSTSGERKLRAELYKKNSYGVWTQVESRTATIQTSGVQTLQFSNLENGACYCFRLYNATSTGNGNRYINGSVIISRSYIR
ncbi:MAG: hypothetical protein IK990_15005 [Ruminiclostridium sp.]|nr:hypothetical protein [Ruminococcus sp.]MBP3856911.1 hypothetical protein [Ruminiclostridium sp.]